MSGHAKTNMSTVYRRVLGPNQGAYGPLLAPVAEPPLTQLSDRQLGEQTLQELRDLPRHFAEYFRKAFIMQPREVRPFTVFPNPTNPVNVPAGTPSTILSYQVAEKYAGFITEFGVYVNPSNYQNVAWTLLIDGMPHPELNQQVILVNSLAGRFPFSYELTSGKLLEMRATNNGGAALDVSAVICGWTEYLTDNKDYGLNPQGGSV